MDWCLYLSEVLLRASSQVMERKKLMRPRKMDSVTGAKQEGDLAIGELVQKLIMLYPMAIDPHGRFGPLLM